MKIARIALAIALLIMAVLLLVIPAKSEEEIECWILCQPDSFVNARMNPKKRSIEIGRLECGDKVYTDGIIKNGFLHIYGMSFEAGEGWVHKGYVVYDEPYRPVFQDTTVKSNGRVKARKTINGPKRCWLKDGQSIKVYYVSSEWSLTNKGFVKTKYLDLGR